MCAKHFSASELTAFQRDGYIVVPQMYTPDEVARLSSWIDDLAARDPTTGTLMPYYEDSLRAGDDRILSRLEKFLDDHDEFRAFVDDSSMTGRAGELLEGPAVLFKEKINFKLPGGDGFKPHQDIQPGWDDYAPYFLSVLVTVDESTDANGCLELSPGHHKRGLIGRRWEPLEGAELDGVVFQKFPMAPGDVAFFDCFVPHQSEPNLTDRPRRGLYLTFNRLSDGDHRLRYFADKRKSFPPDHEREPGKQYDFKV